MILACSRNTEKASEVKCYDEDGRCQGRMEKWAVLDRVWPRTVRWGSLILVATKSHWGQGLDRRESYCALHKEIDLAAAAILLRGSYLKKRCQESTRACAKMFFAVLFITVKEKKETTQMSINWVKKWWASHTRERCAATRWWCGYIGLTGKNTCNPLLTKKRWLIEWYR